MSFPNPACRHYGYDGDGDGDAYNLQNANVPINANDHESATLNAHPHDDGGDRGHVRGRVNDRDRGHDGVCELFSFLMEFKELFLHENCAKN